jgi:transposase
MAGKKSYTREFKEEAVRLARQNGNSSETARSLGLQLSVLRRWKKELEDHLEKAFPGKGHTHDEELRRLQRENQRLKETVGILKKAMGIFTSRPQADPTQVSCSAEIPVC